MSQATDGVCLEMVIDPFLYRDQKLMRTAFEQYQILLNAGTRVLFVTPTTANPPVYLYERETRFLAGMAMVLDGPMVHYPFWKANPSWQMWPVTFGNPTGPATLFTITRTFERGSIEVDCLARTVKLNL